MDDGRLQRARDAWSRKRAALRQDARDSYECGVYDTHQEAAKAMGVSLRTMHSWLKGCSPPRYAPTNTRHSPIKRGLALSLWREGLGVRSIGRKLWVSPQIVSYWIKQEKRKALQCENPTM